MPDTGPITDSFPWLAMRYKPVFDNRNGTPGDVYRLVYGTIAPPAPPPPVQSPDSQPLGMP